MEDCRSLKTKELVYNCVACVQLIKLMCEEEELLFHSFFLDQEMLATVPSFVKSCSSSNSSCYIELEKEEGSWMDQEVEERTHHSSLLCFLFYYIHYQFFIFSTDVVGAALHNCWVGTLDCSCTLLHMEIGQILCSGPPFSLWWWWTDGTAAGGNSHSQFLPDVTTWICFIVRWTLDYHVAGCGPFHKWHLSCGFVCFSARDVLMSPIFPHFYMGSKGIFIWTGMCYLIFSSAVFSFCFGAALFFDGLKFPFFKRSFVCISVYHFGCIFLTLKR